MSWPILICLLSFIISMGKVLIGSHHQGALNMFFMFVGKTEVGWQFDNYILSHLPNMTS